MNGKRLSVRVICSVSVIVGLIALLGIFSPSVIVSNIMGSKSVYASNCDDPCMVPTGSSSAAEKDCVYGCDEATQICTRGGCEDCPDGKVPSVEENSRNSKCVKNCKVCKQGAKKVDKNRSKLENNKKTFEKVLSKIEEAENNENKETIPVLQKNSKKLKQSGSKIKKSGNGLIHGAKELNRVDVKDVLDVPSLDKVNSLKQKAVEHGQKLQKMAEDTGITEVFWGDSPYPDIDKLTDEMEGLINDLDKVLNVSSGKINCDPFCDKKEK